MKATRMLRVLVAALAVLTVAGCHRRLPRPGKPTAPQQQPAPAQVGRGTAGAGSALTGV